MKSKNLFSGKKDLTFHANCLQWRQSAQNVQTCFLGKKKQEKYFNRSSAENFTLGARNTYL